MRVGVRVGVGVRKRESERGKTNIKWKKESEVITEDKDEVEEKR